MEVLERIVDSGVIAVVRLPNADHIESVFDALLRGGVRTVEITLTTKGALAALERLAKRAVDGVTLGAGTVLDREAARISMLSGARFIVTPSLSIPVIEFVKQNDAVVIGGALTPTEVLAASQAGADAVKVFPCDAVGGASYLRSLCGPFPHIRLIPSGGVNAENAGAFIRAGACAVAAGSSLVDPALVEQWRFDLMEERARAHIDAVARARGNDIFQ